MSITFEVLDVTCEQASQLFFVPQARMTTKSTTTFAQLFGFSEFITSTPPKKYRKATVTGVAERIGYTCEQTPRQCAGAMYTWGGFSEYNMHGVLTQSYSKKFFAQCPKQYWPIVPQQLNPNAIFPTSSPLFPQVFVGYCWPADLNSCSACAADLLDWPLIGDVTTNNPQLDLTAFLRNVNAPVVTSTSWSISDQVAGFTGLESPTHTTTGTGNVYNVTVGSQSFTAEEATTVPPLAFPIVYMSGASGGQGLALYEAAYINFIDASNYSMVLSEEYTDADALANATIQTGTGNTASTQPRTTGFISVYVSVVFTITLSNLIAGKSYVVEVDMWEKGVGPLGPISTHTPKQYGFDATDTTHTITDVVATPSSFRTITVQNPTITFAPLPT